MHEGQSGSGDARPLLATVASPPDTHGLSIPPALNDWLRDDVFNNDALKRRQKFVIATGFVLGVISAYTYLPVGGDFGRVLEKWWDTGYENIYFWAFGINAYIPIAALSASFTQRKLRELTTKALRSKWKTYRSDYKFVRYPVRFLLVFTAIFGGAQRAYLTEHYAPQDWFFKTFVSALAGIVAFNIVLSVFLSFEQTFVNLLLKCSSANKSTLQDEDFIRNVLVAVTQKMAAMDDDEIERVHAELFNRSKTSAEKLRYLLQIADAAPTFKQQPIARKIISFLGIIFGITGAYAFYGIGIAQAELLCKAVGLSSCDKNGMDGLSSVMTPLAVAGMSGYTSFLGFGRVYDAIANCCAGGAAQSKPVKYTSFPHFRKLVSWFATFEGFTSGVPGAYLTIYALQQSFTGIALALTIAILGFSTFTAHCSYTAWSVHTFFLDVFNWLVGGDDKSAAIIKKRDQVLSAPNKLISNLPDMSPELVSAIKACKASRHGLFGGHSSAGGSDSGSDTDSLDARGAFGGSING